MAPIHDTDLEEKRTTHWTVEEWKDYELWEAIDARERRRKRISILFTSGLFLVLLAIPVWQERGPLWSANWAATKLAREVSLAKKESALSGKAVRLTVEMSTPGLQVRKEILENCTSPKASPRANHPQITIRQESSGLGWLPEERAVDWSVPGLITSLCYDPLAGTETSGNFAIIPVKDLARGRSDRVSILQVSGSGANLTIE